VVSGICRCRCSPWRMVSCMFGSVLFFIKVFVIFWMYFCCAMVFLLHVKRCCSVSVSVHLWQTEMISSYLDAISPTGSQFVVSLIEKFCSPTLSDFLALLKPVQFMSGSCACVRSNLSQ
jgi:hypothetical protein